LNGNCNKKLGYCLEYTASAACISFHHDANLTASIRRSIKLANFLGVV